MDRFLISQGLSFIACRIFKLLDTSSLTKCRLVCILWNDFLSQRNFYWQRFFVEIEETRRFKKLVRWHPEWHGLLKHFEQCRCLEESKLFIKLMHRFLGLDQTLYDNPMDLAVANGDIEEVQILIHKLEYSVSGFLTAAETNREDIVTLFLDESKKRKLYILESAYGQSAFCLACSKGHTGIVKILLLEAKSSGCLLNIESGFASACQTWRLIPIFFYFATWRTRISLGTFIAKATIQRFINLICERKMSFMIVFFCVVFGIFIISVHLRKL